MSTSALQRPKIQWLRCLPFFVMHLLCLGIFWVGWSPIAIILAFVLFVSRGFGITGFYHRYFSHRAFKTSRFVQFLGACLGNAAVQRGPIWWAAHHRAHHQHSDMPEDVHSPHQSGFWFSHVGWFMTTENYKMNERYVKDLVRFPELRFLNRFDLVIPVLLAVGLFVLGEVLRLFAPSLGTSGMQLLIWGFFVSTILIYHVTFAVNSVGHLIGHQRYKTRDHSRNNFLLALLALGEGWHNNHHHFPSSARNGFRWWEIDITYYALVILSWMRVIWELKPVPQKVLVPAKNQG